MEELISMTNKEYNAIHWWLKNNMTKEKKCQHCGTKDGIIDNALKICCKHEKNVDNYLKLCRKCHYKYDHPNGVKHTVEAKN